MSLRTVVLAAVVILGASAGDLTKANFDSETSGKQVFIKFMAPWCGHCQQLAPAWDKLMEEFASSTSSVVGKVDCTTDEDLCTTYGVEGYPTIKYGDLADLKDYQGEREYEALSTFAKENLGPVCSPKHLELCDEAQKKAITEAEAMSDADIEAKLKTQDDAIKAAEKKFEEKVEALQKQYEDLSKEKEDALALLRKEGGVGLLTSICKERPSCTPPAPPPSEDEEGGDGDGDEEPEEEPPLDDEEEAKEDEEPKQDL